MKFNYVAVNSKNRKYKGEMIATSISEVSKNLQARGLTALSIDEAIDPSAIPNSQKNLWERDLGNSDIHKIKIKKKRILTFCHQMALMMKAGISLSVAMNVMLDTEKDKNMLKILKEINSELYNGIPLSVSLGHYETFPEILVNLVQAGEANGRLDTAFEQSATIIDKEMKLVSKVKGAMGYPGFLLGLTVVLVVILSVVVLPQFKGLFESFDQELPMITQLVMGFSDVLMGYWYIFITVIVLIIVAIKLLIKYNENFAMFLDINKLRIPLIGTVQKQTYISRFCRIMGTLTTAGVSILNSLELSRDVIANLYIKDCLEQIIEDVKIGTPINVSMSRYQSVFDSMLVSMIRVGEESGMLSDSMVRMADLYEQQADESTSKLTEAMTPMMTIMIAGVVGVVAISIVVPMFGMYSVISGG